MTFNEKVKKVAVLTCSLVVVAAVVYGAIAYNESVAERNEFKGKFVGTCVEYDIALSFCECAYETLADHFGHEILKSLYFSDTLPTEGEELLTEKCGTAN